MSLLNRGVARAIGIPREPTAYQPRIARMQTNIGAACWRFQTNDRGATLYAPALPPVRYLCIGAAVSLVMIGGVVGVYIAFRSSGDSKIARLFLAIGWLPLLLGLSGVWLAVLWGNARESKRGPVLRFDAGKGLVQLPRTEVEFSKSDVLRFELVSFCVTTGGKDSYSCTWNKHLVLVRKAPGGAEHFELLFANGSPCRKIVSQLADSFGVRELATCSGNYSSNGTKLAEL